MAAIYNYETADTISAGLQGSKTCDAALIAARQIASDRDTPVVLEDDDGTWLVNPDGDCEELATDWA